MARAVECAPDLAAELAQDEDIHNGDSSTGGVARGPGAPL